MRRMLLVPIVWALLASTATAQELRVRTQALLAERRQGTVTAASVQVLTGVTSITIEGDIAQADRGDPSNAMTVRVYLSLDGGFSWQPWGGFSWRGTPKNSRKEKLSAQRQAMPRWLSISSK